MAGSAKICLSNEEVSKWQRKAATPAFKDGKPACNNAMALRCAFIWTIISASLAQTLVGSLLLSHGSWRRLLGVPLDSKEIKPVHPKVNQPWIFIGRTDAEAEAPILWPPDVKSRLIEKDPDAETDWGQEDKGAKEDEMVGWHHRLSEYEFKQTRGDGEGQGSLACCSPWGRKESDMTEQLNNHHHLTANAEGWGRVRGRKVWVCSSCDSLHNGFWPWNGLANLFPQSYLPS